MILLLLGFTIGVTFVTTAALAAVIYYERKYGWDNDY